MVLVDLTVDELNLLIPNKLGLVKNFILILAMLIITKFKLRYTYVKLITVILLFVHFHLTLPHKFTLNARIVPDPLFWENCIGTASLFLLYPILFSFLLPVCYARPIYIYIYIYIYIIRIPMRNRYNEFIL